MLQNITKISKKVFDCFLSQHRKVYFPKNLYLVYFYLNEVIEDAKLVANHYLALRFDEEFLQNSLLGTSQDKWRYFLNKDLENLNDTVKKYLFKSTYYYIEKSNKIDLSSYESRVKLKEEILKEVDKLENLRNKIAEYIRKNFTIDDLLFKGNR
jgi:hypothetical protein